VERWTQWGEGSEGDGYVGRENTPNGGHQGICPTPLPFHMLPPNSSALPGLMPDISGGTSCTAHCPALSLEFHSSQPRPKLDNRPSRAGWGRLKEVQKASMAACQSEVDSSDPGFSGTCFPGPWC
jgi:hypothetical protein